MSEIKHIKNFPLSLARAPPTWMNYLHQNIKHLDEQNITNNIILSQTLDIFKYIKDDEKNIYISLSTIPPRFVSNEYIIMLDSLFNQIVKPKEIIINICKIYRRNFNIEIKHIEQKMIEYKNKYNNIYFNYTEDYGPITKVLGLHKIENKFNDQDIIIILDDDWEMDNKLTFFYKLCYQLYDSDCVFIPENKLINWQNTKNIIDLKYLYSDNYQDMVFGWLSFSFKYKYLMNLYNFYNQIIKLDDYIFYHDDLILSIYYKYYKLYAISMNVVFNKNINSRLSLSNLNALHLEKNAQNLRQSCETKILNYYNYKFEYIRNRINIINNISEPIFIKKMIINKRNYLINIIDDLIINCNTTDLLFDTKYLSNNIILLTITKISALSDNPILTNFVLNIHNILYNINFDINERKKTLIISFNVKPLLVCNNIDTPSTGGKIIKIDNDKKYNYCEHLLTTLICVRYPEYEYKIFDQIEIFNYINNKCIDIFNYVFEQKVINKLFIILFLYHDCSLYINDTIILKNILKNLSSSEQALSGNENFIYVQNQNNLNFSPTLARAPPTGGGKYLFDMIYNIIN